MDLFYQAWSQNGATPHGKPVLIFIHGIAEHSSRYRFPGQYFSKRGFPVYAMDLRGHGQSAGRRVYAESFDQLLEDIHHFVRWVRRKEKGKKIILIGHSFGGQLVLNFGSLYPDRLDGIIVSSPNIRLAIKIPWIKRRLAPILSQWFPILALNNEINPSMLSHDSKVVEDYKKDPTVQKKITARLADIILKNQDRLPALAHKFKIPSLFLHAGDDHVCSTEGTREFFENIPIKDKGLKIYPGLYHEIFNETKREQVFRDMEKWISEHA